MIIEFKPLRMHSTRMRSSCFSPEENEDMSIRSPLALAYPTIGENDLLIFSKELLNKLLKRRRGPSIFSTSQFEKIHVPNDIAEDSEYFHTFWQN